MAFDVVCCLAGVKQPHRHAGRDDVNTDVSGRVQFTSSRLTEVHDVQSRQHHDVGRQQQTFDLSEQTGRPLTTAERQLRSVQ